MDEAAPNFYRTLLETQYLSVERMRAYQERLLERLVRHAHAQVPFYRDTGRLAALFRADGSLDWSRWQDIPPLTRPEAQANQPRLAADSVPEQVGEIRSSLTSGSTGIPFEHRTTAMESAAMRAASERFAEWHGFDRAATYAQIVDHLKFDTQEYPFGYRRKGWSLLVPESPWLVNDIRHGNKALADWLVRESPRYVETFPNLAALLVDAIGARPSGMRWQYFISVGEKLRADHRSKLRSFGVTALDVYSTQEAGPIAHECPHCGLLHVASELQLLELHDPSGLPVQEGEAGACVITPLYGYAMPLIRYRFGDFARPARNDPRCRITLPALASVSGRDREPFLRRDGSRRWLPLETIDLSQYVHFRQFQIVQVAAGEIEIRVVSERDQPVTDQAALTRLLSDWMLEPVQVRVVRVPEIAPGAGGKIQDVITLV